MQKLARWQLGLPLALILAFLLVVPASQRLEFWFYDSLVGHYPLAPPDNLSIVGIDEASLEALGRWPWPRTYHARLLGQLERLGARVVAFDVLFTEPARDLQQDQALAAAMASHGQVVLPLHLYPLRSREALAERLPVPALTETAAALGHVHVELDDDGIARGLFLREGLGRAVWPNLALAALEQLDSSPLGINSRQGVPFVNMREEEVRIPFAGLGGAIPTYSYVDILNGRLPPGALAGHTVFVGATAAGFGDVLPTPLSGKAYPLSGVEFHANVYSALAQDALIEPLPRPWVWFIGLALVLVTMLVLPRLRPERTLGAVIVLALVPVALSLALFVAWGLWLPPVSLVLVCLLAYPIWSGRRLSVLKQFLNRQLESLAREPRMLLSVAAFPTPTHLYDHITELLQPARSWLSRDGQTVRGKPPAGLRAPDQPGRWMHGETRSQVAFDQGGSRYQLGLEWSRLPDDHEALTRYLDRLPLPRAPWVDGRRSQERLTRRIQQAQAVAQAMADMRLFIAQGFERMPDGVIVADALGVIQVANGHVADWFAVPASSLPGMPLTRLLTSSDADDPDHWRHAVQAALTGQRYSSESLKVNGYDLLLHLAPFPKADGKRPGLIANLVDITEVREQQRQYREAIDFISHDVRSPLVSQLALIQQLKRQDGPASPEQLDHVAMLARRSYQLAEEFVQLARAEQIAEIQFYEAEVLAIAENAIDAVREQAQSKQTRLEIEGEEDLWMRGNAELAERAVINLLTNAIAYSPAGTEVRVRVERDDGYALISVSDSGPGIPAEALPRLFQRFQRSRREEQGGQRGAGLGLAFVQVVAERHGGRVDVTSNPGHGSTFRLYLPLAEGFL